MIDTVNLEIVQGGDWVQSLSFANDDASPMSFVGAHLQVRPFPSAPPALDMSTANGALVQVGNVLSWHQTAAQTAAYAASPASPAGYQPTALQAFFGYFDLFLKFSDGEIRPYLSGQLFLDQSITLPF